MQRGERREAAGKGAALSHAQVWMAGLLAAQALADHPRGPGSLDPLHVQVMIVMIVRQAQSGWRMIRDATSNCAAQREAQVQADRPWGSENLDPLQHLQSVSDFAAQKALGRGGSMNREPGQQKHPLTSVSSQNCKHAALSSCTMTCTCLCSLRCAGQRK